MTRRNLCTNPAAKNNTTGWGGAVTFARTTTLTGLPRTTGIVITDTSGGTFINTPTGIVAPGDVTTISLYYKNDSTSFTFSKTIYISYKRSSGGDVFPESFSTGTLGDVGNIVRLSYTTAPAPALTTGIYLTLDNWGAANVGFEITCVLYEPVGTLDTYFDGDTPGASWDGANGNSSSTLGAALSVPPGAFLPFFGG